MASSWFQDASVILRSNGYSMVATFVMGSQSRLEDSDNGEFTVTLQENRSADQFDVVSFFVTMKSCNSTALDPFLLFILCAPN